MDTWIKIPAILCLVCIVILGIVSLRVPEETLIVNVYDISTNSTLQNVNVVLTDLESGKTMEKDLVSGGLFPVTANHSYQYPDLKRGICQQDRHSYPGRLPSLFPEYQAVETNSLKTGRDQAIGSVYDDKKPVKK